jgi:hypothetical protein
MHAELWQKPHVSATAAGPNNSWLLSLHHISFRCLSPVTLLSSHSISLSRPPPPLQSRIPEAICSNLSVR